MDSSSFSPAIVLGGGINALGVLRSLAQAGLPLWVADSQPDSPAMRSRFGQKAVLPTLESAECVLALNALVDSLPGTPMLFPTEEKTVHTLSSLRAALHPRIRLRQAAEPLLSALMHKDGFAQHAAQLNAPVPRTCTVRQESDLESAAALRFPCVFKPTGQNKAYGARFKKAYKVQHLDEVRTLYREIAPVCPEMVVQEWIEGADSDIYFCLQYLGENSTPVASFPGRKLRAWPPAVGGTASCTAAWEHEEELTRLTHDFFSRLGFSGLCSMEYKRDVRDGAFYMVEPTVGRTDFQEEVATLNGCNLPLLAYCHEFGLALPESGRAEPPRIWQEAQIERWAREQTGHPDPVEASRLPRIDALWRWNDPRPATDAWLRRVRQRIGRAA